MAKKLILVFLCALFLLCSCSKQSTQPMAIKTIVGSLNDDSPYELNIITEKDSEFTGIMKWVDHKTWIYVEGSYPTSDSVNISEKYYIINKISKKEFGDYKGGISENNIDGISTSGAKFSGVIDETSRPLSEFEEYVWQMAIKEKISRLEIAKLNSDILAYYRKQDQNITEEQAKEMRYKVAELSLPILKNALELENKMDEQSGITQEILQKEMATRLGLLTRYIDYNDVNARKYQQFLDMLDLNYPGYFVLTEKLFQVQMDNKYSNANWDDKDIKNEYYKDQKDFYTKFVDADIFYEDKLHFIFCFAYNVLEQNLDYQDYLLGEIQKLEANENLQIDDQIDRMKQTVNSIVKAAKMINNPAPQILHKDINGVEFDLTACKGKIVFLEYWATWCGPCKKATPKLIEIYNKYENNKDFVMVSVALDDLASVKEYVKANNMEWAQLVPESDPWNSTLATDYAITGVPTAFLIDRKGIVKERLHPGDAELENKLAEILNN